MDGPKAVRYYDAATRSVKVSRNVTFNENEEPEELEIIEVPGLQVEGENGNPTQQPKSIQKPQEAILSEPRQL